MKWAVMAPTSRFQEQFACTPSDARRARKAVVSFAQAWLASIESIDFELAVGEALANAIEHGKCSSISVDCTYTRRRIVCEIGQDGEGFRPPSRVNAPEGGALRGYGIFIMQQALDRLEFLGNGTRVRLVKAVKGELRT